MFNFRKNKRLLEDIEKYLDIVNDSYNIFTETIKYLLTNSIDSHFEVSVEKMSQLESKANDMRRDIETIMYEKSILPETRGNVLLILDAIDKLPNTMESILYMFLTQKVEVIDVLKDDIIELMDITKTAINDTTYATKDCFGKMAKVKDLNESVDNSESLGDKLERKMITKLFEMDLTLGEKIIQKEYILKFGSLCDLCETAMDRVLIFNIKRHL